MRLSYDHTIGAATAPAPASASSVAAAPAPPVATDPAAPDLTYLAREFGVALQSFFATIDRIVADNPVDAGRLQELAVQARAGSLGAAQGQELQQLKTAALRQGRAVGAVLGFFLKFSPQAMFTEIRDRAKVFQPLFGPLMVVDGATVREVFERDQEFTVEPYGVEMTKVMTPAHNGGFSSFILSTDDTAVYQPDKQLLTAVCRREDAELVTTLLHEECVRRVDAAVAAAGAAGSSTIDIVSALARYVPVTLGHRYLGVPVAAQVGSFELTPEMLLYYGAPVVGHAETALAKGDGVIPDEQTMYLWIKSAFQHFFNNVQKDPDVASRGIRACRLLLAYLLRQIAVERQRIEAGQPIDDTMLTRLLRLQMGRPVPGVTPPPDLDPKLVSDLRIAENVMGTIVGAVAGQEEATCRVIDAMMRLQAGEYQTVGSDGPRYGSFAEAQRLARDVLAGRDVEAARARLYRYAMEALRLEPQGEVLLRKCARDGARIADSRPIAAGTLVFAAHGSAMKHVPEPDAFVLDRPREHVMPYGWNRHACLGQHVSPVILVESMIAVLGLDGLCRPEARSGEKALPLERRFGRLQLDDLNLYADTFSLQFVARTPGAAS